MVYHARGRSNNWWLINKCGARCHARTLQSSYTKHPLLMCSRSSVIVIETYVTAHMVRINMVGKCFGVNARTCAAILVWQSPCLLLFHTIYHEEECDRSCRRVVLLADVLFHPPHVKESQRQNVQWCCSTLRSFYRCLVGRNVAERGIGPFDATK